MSIIVNGIELTEVIYAGVNLDIVKVKKGTAEAVTVFEKITQLATPQNVTADGTVVSWDEVENATSYEIYADGVSIGTVEAAVTEDALEGMWVFNDTVNFSALSTEDEFDFNWSVNYKVSGDSRDFVRMNANRMHQEDENGNPILGGNINYIPYFTGIPEPIVAYEFAGDLSMWHSDSYKTINITSKLSEVTNGEQLLTWLQANATKQ